MRVAREQNAALTEYFAEALRAGGAGDADLLALQLTLIFDGASSYSVVRGGSTPATRQAVQTLLSAHAMSRRHSRSRTTHSRHNAAFFGIKISAHAGV